MPSLWFPSVGTFGIVLSVTGSLLSLLVFTGWKRISLALVFTLLGTGEIASIQKADRTHELEVRNQHDDIEMLRKESQKSETQRQMENDILRTKLEDYAGLSQLGPALMKLAQNSAEFQKKQYEIKVMSDRDLHDLTLKATKKIREFSTKYAALELRRQQARLSFTPRAASEVDWQKRFSDDVNESFQVSHAKQSEFQTSILPDALYARNGLLRRNLPEPFLEPSEKINVNIALKGMLAGIDPEMSLATYLELWAKPLAQR